MNKNILIEQLNAFDPNTRRTALQTLARDRRPNDSATPGNVNMHLHSFFSYNAEGFSPSRLAWECSNAGLYAAGLCDFDVLDGIDEFIAAGLQLGLRATVNIETRSFVSHFANVDINSPGEPGVSYIMGAGFYKRQPDGSPQAAELASFRNNATARNRALINRINSKTPDIAINYDSDVLPLTPAGCATERHIISAYINHSRSRFGSAENVARYWAKILNKSVDEVVVLLGSTPDIEEAVRARLAKRGGLGYEQPTPATFPPVERFLKWVADCDAIPMATWLDGTSGGEQDPKAFLECFQAAGAASLNIIPDRNWNIADPTAKAKKTANLAAIVRQADAMHLPINIGTEMNRAGLPFVDNLDGEALRPYKQTFLQGAQLMVGHTLLGKFANFPYMGPAAAAEFPNRSARNSFFQAVGALPALDESSAARLADMGPTKALSYLHDATRRN